MNADGEWIEVVGTLSISDVTISRPEGTASPIEGISCVADGIETSREGVTDLGGGEEDALLIKNYPR